MWKRFFFTRRFSYRPRLCHSQKHFWAKQSAPPILAYPRGGVAFVWKWWYLHSICTYWKRACSPVSRGEWWEKRVLVGRRGEREYVFSPCRRHASGRLLRCAFLSEQCIYNMYIKRMLHYATTVTNTRR